MILVMGTYFSPNTLYGFFVLLLMGSILAYLEVTLGRRSKIKTLNLNHQKFPLLLFQLPSTVEFHLEPSYRK